MKKTAIVLLFALAISVAPACKESGGRADEKNVVKAVDVPEAVRTSFASRYPGASEVIWETAHEGDIATFKVKFKQDGEYMKAEFGEAGNLVKEKKDNG